MNSFPSDWNDEAHSATNHGDECESLQNFIKRLQVGYSNLRNVKPIFCQLKTGQHQSNLMVVGQRCIA